MDAQKQLNAACVEATQCIASLPSSDNQIIRDNSATMSLYRNVFRRESLRWKHWNYANEGCYSVTICTNDRIQFFGEIIHATMILNEIGSLVEEEWLKTPVLRPDMNLLLDKFRVMPDHFHGIIFIGSNDYNDNCKNSLYDAAALPGLPIMFGDDAVNQIGPMDAMNRFGPQSKNLGAIIRGFKTAVTKRARKINPHFKWQTRYHEHVVRDFDSLEKIRDYIEKNPANWKGR